MQLHSDSLPLMKLVLAFLCVTLSSCHYSASSLQFNEEIKNSGEFVRLLKSSDHTLILFQHELCIFSKSMLANLKQAVEEITDVETQKVSVGVVNCARQSELCGHVPYYPYVLLLKGPRIFAQYTSSRESSSLKGLIESLNEDVFQQVNESDAKLPHYLDYMDCYMVIKVKNAVKSQLLVDLKEALKMIPQHFTKVYIVEDSNLEEDSIALFTKTDLQKYDESKISNGNSEEMRVQLMSKLFIRDIFESGSLEDIRRPRKNTVLLFINNNDPHSLKIVETLEKAFIQGKFNDIMIDNHFYKTDLDFFLKNSPFVVNVRIDQLLPISIVSTLAFHKGFLPVDFNDKKIFENEDILIESFRKAVKDVDADSHSLVDIKTFITISERDGKKVSPQHKSQVNKDAKESIGEALDSGDLKFVTYADL